MATALIPGLEEALAEWRRRVEADKEQVERLREVPDGADFYGPIANNFRANPHRTGEPVLEVLRDLVRPDETWIDIGAGGGRFTLPLALRAKSVVAVEPSEGMLGVMRDGMAEYGISNIEIVQSRWDDSVEVEADCSLMSFVGNDIADIGPFIDHMERATRRMCTFINLDRPPPSQFANLWEHVHGEPRALLPAFPEFISLLLAKKRLFEVRLVPRTMSSHTDRETLIANARKQTWVRPGSEKDRRLHEFIDANLVERDGRYTLTAGPETVGIITWSPS